MNPEDIEEQELDQEIEQELDQLVEPADPPEPAELTEVEQEARKYGWRPKSDFDRDPDNWVDAEKFMSFPTTQNRILRDELRERDARLEENVAKRVSAMEGMFRQQMEHQHQQQRAAHEAELARIGAEKLAAVQTGDLSKYQTLDRQEQGLQAPVAPEPAPNPALEVVERYRAQNEWTQDPVMWQAAINAVGNNTTLSADQQLKLGEAAVKQMFPEKFQAPAPKPAPKQRVDSGGLGGAAKAGKGVQDLPAEARAQGKQFVEDGVFKSIEEYAAAYHSQ